MPRPCLSIFSAWFLLGFLIPSTASAQKDKDFVTLSVVRPSDITPFTEMFIALYNLENPKDPLSYAQLQPTEQLNSRRTLPKAEDLFLESRQIELKNTVLKKLPHQNPSTNDATKEKYLIVEILLSTETNPQTGQPQKVARHISQAFSDRVPDTISHSVFTPARFATLTSACPADMDATCMQSVVDAALAAARRAAQPGPVGVAAPVPLPPPAPIPVVAQPVPSTHPVPIPQNRPQVLADSFAPLYKESAFRSRTRPMHWALGLLTGGFAASAALTVTLGIVNWGTSLGNLDLGSTCGPSGMMSCGVVQHDLTSGFWISFTTTLGLGIGSTAAFVVDYNSWKERLCRAGMNPCDKE